MHAAKGVSFAAYMGEAIGLIGSNGSSKSTLLSAIAGLLRTDRGQVYTSGQPSLLGGERRLDERPHRGEERRPGRARDGHVEAAGARALPGDRRLLRDQREGDFISLPMRTYFSGMSARLRFSIAVAKDHDVLLVDEALLTGDRAFQKHSERRIRELREQAGTIFLVSHNHKSIQDTCERVLWMEGGVLRLDGPSDAVIGAYEESTGR